MWRCEMKLTIALAGILLFTFGAAMALDDRMDIGATVDGVQITENDTVWVDEAATFDIYFENADTLGGYSAGFIIWSDDGADWRWEEYFLEAVYIPGTWPPEFDSVYSVVTAIEGSRQYPPSAVWDQGGFQISLADTNGPPYDTILFGGTRKDHGLYPGPLELQMQMHFVATEPTTGLISTICIDSAKVGEAGDFIFIDIAGRTSPPTALWPEGGRCYPVKKEGAASPPVIILDPPQIGVTGIIGTYTPSAEISVTNGGIGTMNWSVTNSEAWLTPDPPGGVDDGIIDLVFDITGLDEGVYYDTVVVSSPEAINSPQKVPVTLTIIALPPEIEYEPSGFSASAIQGGANPDDRYLHIWSDVPGSELEWTVSNSSTWLTLWPATGLSHDSTKLEFDIRGLGYGVYYDTIVITDPEATNSPQHVPVTLQIVSDLPVLAFDPDTLHVVVLVETSEPPAVVTVYNSGEGVMTFEASEGCSWITGINPQSGTAPQDVSISFKTYPLHVGDYYCPVTFTSPEAVNSPQDLIVHLHVTDDPAEISLVPSSVEMTYYECWQGPDYIPTGKMFQIFNQGSDPMHWWLTHTSDWLILNPTSGFNNQIVSVYVLNLDEIPVGTYVDTVVVYSNEAINSPESLLVTLDIIPGDQDPELAVTETGMDIPAQEVFGAGAALVPLTEVYNLHPGCMDYRVEEDIPWLKIIDTLGSAPENLKAVVEIGSYTYGTYPDSFFVHSPTAINSPIRVDVNLLVWRLHGDANWTNSVNIGDVVYLTNFIYYNGPGPIPEYIVGDCNGDQAVNVGDIVYLLNYIFYNGPEPLGNPK